jgi:hypothetical protein
VEAAVLLNSGIWVAVEGEVLPAGSGMHYPYCNDGRCPGCIPQEIIDDYASMAEHVRWRLVEGLVEARAWVANEASGYDLDRFAWMYRYRLTNDTLRWSDIRITGLGIS